MDDRHIDELFHIDEKKYGINYKTNLFEQYKIFLQMVDNLIQRRTIANSFFSHGEHRIISCIWFDFSFTN